MVILVLILWAILVSLVGTVVSDIIASWLSLSACVINVSRPILDGADSVDEAPKMVFTKPLHVEDNKLTYFEMVEPASLRYIYRARPARDFGVDFVSHKVFALHLDKDWHYWWQQGFNAPKGFKSLMTIDSCMNQSMLKDICLILTSFCFWQR